MYQTLWKSPLAYKGFVKGYFMIVYPQFPQQNYLHIFQVSRALESFDVEERHMSTVETVCPNVKVIHKPVASLDTDNHVSTILSHLIKGKRSPYN